MLIESLITVEVLAPLLSGIAVLLLYNVLGARYLAPEYLPVWTQLRRTVLATGESYVRTKTSFALTNPSPDSHKIGTVDCSSQELAHHFGERGYLQSVASGLKYRPRSADPRTGDASFEDGTMVFRESQTGVIPDFLALRQVHVWWFENEDGTCDLYAHEEYSSLNPLVAALHYKAVNWNVAKGKRIARQTFTDENLLD